MTVDIKWLRRHNFCKVAGVFTSYQVHLLISVNICTNGSNSMGTFIVNNYMPPGAMMSALKLAGRRIMFSSSSEMLALN